MQNLMTSHGDVATQAGLQSTAAGYDEARQRYAQQLGAQQQEFGQAVEKYKMPWERGQVLSGIEAQRAATELGTQQQNYNQALQNYTLPWEQAQTAQGLMQNQYTPQFRGFSGASGYDPADISGATQAGFEAKMGKYNAKQQMTSNILGAAAGLGAGALAGMSDERLKKDITPIAGKEALDAILKLNGYTYKWAGDNSVDSGVLAQEVAEVLPELVLSTEDGVMLVKYSELMAVAIEAIKYLAEGAKQ
jgi:hypothetical protein